MANVSTELFHISNEIKNFVKCWGGGWVGGWENVKANANYKMFQ